MQMIYGNQNNIFFDSKLYSHNCKPCLIRIGIIRMQPESGDFSSWIKFVPGISAVGIPCERQAYQQGSVLIRGKLRFFDGINRADMLLRHGKYK